MVADKPGSRSNSRNTGKKKKKRSPRKWFFGLFFTVVIAIICGIIGYLLIILNGERILSENAEKFVIGEPSVIYDANGVEVAQLVDQQNNRDSADYSEIPKQLIEAVVATEDQRFYEHSGIDLWAIGRALVKDVIARSAVEGGSTITQQLAKNMFLTSDKTFFRKATEASIAVALENKMSKEEIITMYLNRIYMGKGVYGVKAAAKLYFDKDLQDLELWEMATLAGMPKAPSRYNPLSNPELSKERRGVVLQLMYDQGLITQSEMEEAKAVDYVAPDNIEETDNNAYPAFIDYVVDEALKVMPDITEDELRIGGYSIYTTLNQQAQKAVEEEFADDSNFESSVDDQKVQGAMVIMDHSDGAIQAIAGGRDYVRKGLNRAQVQRQPGSAFKPIVSYGPALESGDYTPSTVLENDQRCFGSYCPKDAHGATPVTMLKAVEESRNLPAVWMLNQIGLSTGMKFAEKLGFEFEDQDKNLTIALGGMTKGVTPLQMATAYSAFANDGVSVEAHAIVKIENRAKNAVYKFKGSKGERVMKESTASYMTEMLQAVVQSGTGKKAAMNRPVAGKTGTTQHGLQGFDSSANRDVWFVGYTPQWTAAVWMGYDKTDEQHVLKNSSGQAAAMFSKVMTKAMEGMEKGSFSQAPSTPEPTPTPTKLAEVNGFTANFLPEEMKVQLSWNAAPGEGITYQIFRKEAEAASFEPFLDSVSGTTAEDINISLGMTYQYYVVAYDPATNSTSDPSATVTVEIPEAELEFPEVTPEPTPTPGDTVEPEIPPVVTEPPVETPVETPGEGTETPPPGTDSEEQPDQGDADNGSDPAAGSEIGVGEGDGIGIDTNQGVAVP
ncbi:PBP1A family penicillin-binding protein [Paenibacillus thailandensis]|uniref:PBP1A family penicillin-binding protein n=1 Tax=Paenibacillus thailandensis TaxID=393250 RepID=A0ABW5QU47_9BACL